MTIHESPDYMESGLYYIPLKRVLSLEKDGVAVSTCLGGHCLQVVYKSDIFSRYLESIL